MCLLHEVESWDTSNIVCRAISHKDPQNPLRRNNSLESICGLEYAAQTMAIHIRLTSNPAMRETVIGFVGGIKDLDIMESRLDTVKSILRIRATLLIDQGMNFMYSFQVSSERVDLISGRASIFLQDLGDST